MKRFSSLFLILFSVLFLRNTAEGANADRTAHSFHANVAHHKIFHASPKASMENKKPVKGYTAILFRLGIEGKSIAITYKAHPRTLDIDNVLKDVTVNSSWLKHILLFSGSIVLQPEFISAFSFHAPPALA
jgi:hypothetical protein